MKQRTTQLGVRKNPDSSRVHGLCLPLDSSSSKSGTRKLRCQRLENRERCAFLVLNGCAEEHLLVALTPPIKLKIKSESPRRWKL